MKRPKTLSLSKVNASLQCEIARRLKCGLPITGLLAAALLCGGDKASARSYPVFGGGTEQLGAPAPKRCAGEVIDADAITTNFERDLRECEHYLFAVTKTMGYISNITRSPMYGKWAERLRAGIKQQLAVLEEYERAGKAEDARRSQELMIRGFDYLKTCESRGGTEAAEKLGRKIQEGYLYIALGTKDEVAAKCRVEIKKAYRALIGCDSAGGSEAAMAPGGGLEKVLDAAIERRMRKFRDAITNVIRESETTGIGNKTDPDETESIKEKIEAIREVLKAELKEAEKDAAGRTRERR